MKNGHSNGLKNGHHPVAAQVAPAAPHPPAVGAAAFFVLTREDCAAIYAGVAGTFLSNARVREIVKEIGRRLGDG